MTPKIDNGQRPLRGRDRSEPTEFGRKLRQARTAGATSLESLGESIGVTASYLSKVEGGIIKEPSGAVLVRLARVFNWTLEELFDCFVSEEDERLDQEIETLLRELSHNQQAQLLVKGSQPLLNDLRGKRMFLGLLKELKKRLGS